LEGFITRYKIQSYYPKFGKEAPLGERTRGLLNGIINPIDFTFLKIGDQSPPVPPNPFINADPARIPLFLDQEEKAVRVTIQEVEDIFTLSSVGTPLEERYRGIDKHGYIKPFHDSFSSDPDFRKGAICIDGFLNRGDSAIFHTDVFANPNGTTFLRYFTGGRPLGNGTVVTVAQQNADDPAKFDVTILDNNGANRAIVGVPVLNGTIDVGTRTTLVSQGDCSARTGPAIQGIFIAGASSAGSSITPVEIIEVADEGTIMALAVCKQLSSNGFLTDQGGITFSGVVIVPFAQFASSGDRGFLTTVTVPDPVTGSGVSTTFVQISKPAFVRFG
jgi:hypothetical protein